MGRIYGVKLALARRRLGAGLRREQEPGTQAGHARVDPTRLAMSTAAWQPATLRALQQRAGNHAVGALLSRQSPSLPVAALAPARRREQAVLTWPLRRASRPQPLRQISRANSWGWPPARGRSQGSRATTRLTAP